MNETLQAMMRRRSNRNFLPDMPDDAAIRAIVEAGRAAPSAFDSQARYFAVIRDRQLLDDMNDAVKQVSATLEGEFYQRVGNDENYDVFYRAPVLIVIAGEESSLLVEQDCAAANENILIAAESLGLGACWIGFTRYAFDGPQGDEFRERLHIPEGYVFYCSAVIGHKAIERHDEKVIKGNTTRFF